eukprot:TRINITY_DN6115_c0_g1_i1.p1 TRINITY_DN6115_c0_g1~~TRINITY_DN6115_c0_g1_i1.p1  ORF type:complete len:372 (+),score=133.77 TRINITY_DN6115_c0_g1_i1:70-1185(+)
MPKKSGGAPDKKKVQKAVEDKTFGMKNKNKSKKIQSFINNLQKSATQSNRKAFDEEEKRKALRRQAKEAKEQQEKELAELFKAATTTKVPLGVNPKSIICEFFKKGACTKGAKCKFSHDMAVQRKTAKIDIYTDPREVKAQESGGAEGERPSHITDIICRDFLEALEKKQYGYFWVCPNGGDACRYRHALPPGYVLQEKSNKTEDVEDEEDETPIEEKIEAERAQVIAEGKAVTPCTLENFLKWKAEKKAAREAEVEQKRKEAASKSGGRGLNVLSGRDLFAYDPSLFIDDDGAAAGDDYEVDEKLQEAEEEEEQVVGERLYNVEEQDAEVEVHLESSFNIASNVVNQDLFLENVDLPDDDDEDGEEEDDS